MRKHGKIYTAFEGDEEKEAFIKDVPLMTLNELSDKYGRSYHDMCLLCRKLSVKPMTKPVKRWLQYKETLEKEENFTALAEFGDEEVASALHIPLPYIKRFKRERKYRDPEAYRGICRDADRMSSGLLEKTYIKMLKFAYRNNIPVHTPWKQSKQSFYAWALKQGYKRGMSLVMQNGDEEGYTPESCMFTYTSPEAAGKGVVMEKNQCAGACRRCFIADCMYNPCGVGMKMAETLVLKEEAEDREEGVELYV